MTTLETIIEDLRQVSPQHLEEVHELVLALKAKEAANQQLAEATMRILNDPAAELLPDAAWDEITDYQRRLRAELFTRPNPFLQDDAHAA